MIIYTYIDSTNARGQPLDENELYKLLITTEVNLSSTRDQRPPRPQYQVMG